MAIDLNNVAEKVFKIMKANGLSVLLFDEKGNETLDPLMARRFYSKNKNIMVNIIDNIEKPTLKVGVGISVDIQEMRNFFDGLRNMATQNALSYILRTHGKDITPKEFVQQSLSEAFSRPYGTVKTSRQKYENATLYIKHKKRVNEEIRGSRSRYIHSIFIENNNGERFRFPYKNLVSARAMTVHVSEGGTPYDSIGKYILTLSEEMNELKSFKSRKKGDIGINETLALFINESDRRIKDINKILKRMNNKTGYKHMVDGDMKTESFDVDLLEKYDISLDETYDTVKPYLSKIAFRLNENEKKGNNILFLTKWVMNNGNDGNIFSLSKNDQTNPDSLNFDDEKSRLSAWFGYFANITNDSDISNKLRQLTDDIYVVDEKYVELAKKMLTVLKKFVIVTEQFKIRPSVSILEMYQQEIENTFDSFVGIYK